MRLIDVDALIETMRENAEGNEGWYGDTWAFIRDVEHAPTIDAVPVVRCKDCKCWLEIENCTGTCKRLDNVLFWFGTDATDFCSFAERKDDDRTDF